MYLIANILHRVFKTRLITNDNGDDTIVSGGTMSVIDVDNRQYLVTARHIAEHIDSRVQVQVWRNQGWNSIPVRIVGHGGGDVDVSVLDSNISLIPTEHRFSLPVGLDGIILGQEMMFLGFPTGYDVLTSAYSATGFPMPLVKYARMSAMSGPDYPIWLDGHNNEGFSGSPVCFVRNGESDVRVAGVISAYQHIPKPVFTQDGYETGLFHQENMGLALAWDIQRCIDIINQNPIGLEFSSL